MVTFAYAVVAYLRALFLTRHRLALEAVVLRQQLAVCKRKQPRPKLDHLDRLFWIVFRQLWDGWSEALIIVKPETVVSWHRAGFPAVLAVAVSATSTRATKSACGYPPVNSAHEGGEPHMGGASHPW